MVQAELLEERLDDVLANVRRQQCVDVDLCLVLARHDDRVHADRLAFLVLDRHLRLAVRPEVRDQTRLADFGEPVREAVREPDRHRHERVGLANGVADHHPLVACSLRVEVRLRFPLALFQRVVDADGDVCRLLLDGNGDPARLAVEPVLRARVADLGHRLADDRGDVDVGRSRDLAGDADEPGRYQRLARDPAG